MRKRRLQPSSILCLNACSSPFTLAFLASPFFVWCNYKSHDLGEEDADDLVRDFRDEYLGQYDDEEDFAYEIIEECYDLPEFAKTYFDYEKFARDLFMCDYWFDDGFVFRAA